MIIKFNGGKLAWLCENCRAIIATGNNIPTDLNKNKEYFCCAECEKEYKLKTKK